MAIGHDLLNVPMGDMIRQMAFAIADAQWELDESSIRIAEMMSGRRILRNGEGNLVDEDGEESATPVAVDTRVYFGHTKKQDGSYEDELLSMLELGFSPNFYQFIDTLIEVKIAIRVSSEYGSERKYKGKQVRYSWGRGHFSATVTPVDATYSSKYTYSAEGSSVLRTKLVPVPPPSILEERIRRLLEQEQDDQAADNGDGS